MDARVMNLRPAHILSLPRVGQELVKLLARHLADFGQDAREVPLRVEAVTLGGRDQRPEPSVAGGGGVIAGE